jgi:hypothetical protein
LEGSGEVSDAPITELEFLRKLQRLLNEGDFTATYKFALLNALADLSLERSTDVDGSLRLSLSAIAEKFIEYYWRQARPYRALDGSGFGCCRTRVGKHSWSISSRGNRRRILRSPPHVQAEAGTRS